MSRKWKSYSMNIQRIIPTILIFMIKRYKITHNLNNKTSLYNNSNKNYYNAKKASLHCNSNYNNLLTMLNR